MATAGTIVGDTSEATSGTSMFSMIKFFPEKAQSNAASPEVSGINASTTSTAAVTASAATGVTNSGFDMDMESNSDGHAAGPTQSAMFSMFSIKEFTEKAQSMASTAATAATSAASNAAKTATSAVVDTATSATSAAVNAASSATSAAVDAATSATSAAVDAASSATSAAANVATSATSVAVNAASSATSAAANAATSATSAAVNAATSATSAAANAATSATSAALNAATSATSAAVNVASSATAARVLVTSVTEAATSAADSEATDVKKWNSDTDGKSNNNDPVPVSKDSNDEPDIAETAEEREARAEYNAKQNTFMESIENGEIGVFMDMLYRKDELSLDLDGFRDVNGLSPLRLAISKGYSGIVELLLKHGARVGDGLLRAVDIGFLETVQKICEYASGLQSAEDRLAILECHCEDDDYHPDVTPIVLAAQENEFAIVKALSDVGCRIEASRSRSKTSSKDNPTTKIDDLQKSVGSLELYKGLASEAYLVQVNDDPVDTAFMLSKKLRYLGQTDVEFRPSYIELAERVDLVGTELISHTRNTEEILTVLNYYETDGNKGESDEHIGPLPKISRAIEFEQKSFVAHPNCQQSVLAKFYGHLAFLRDQGAKTKLSYLLLMVLGFPILSLIYMFFPVQKVKQLVGCPYSKFVLKLASDMFFLVFLTIDIITNIGITTGLIVLTPTKAILLLWILGIAWREIKGVITKGASALKQGGKLRDLILVLFFLLGIALDTTSCFMDRNGTEVTSIARRDIHFMYSLPFKNTYPEHGRDSSVLHRSARASKITGGASLGDDDPSQRLNFTNPEYTKYISYDWWHPKLLATTMFAMSTVISFLRMLQYAVVSDVIGPFQISLGSMISQTANFFVIIGVVLFSFAVGLTYMFSFYNEVQSQTCGGSSGEECEDGKFSNLFFGFLYLFWSALGFEDQEALELGNQAVVIETAGILIYAVFYVLMVIVLLNALIAVMSEAYNTVEENADVEWKFHSTVMWMSILLDDDIIPPPFNLLPSADTIKRFISWLIGRCRRCVNKCRQADDDSAKEAMMIEMEEQSKEKTAKDKAQYKRVINKLVERYVTDKTKDGVSVNAEVNITDILGLKNDLQSLKLEIFQQLFDTNHRIINTTGEGSAIRDTSKRAKLVLNKTEEIHDNVDTDLKITLDDFKTSVLSHQDNILKEVEEFENNAPKNEGFLSGLFESQTTSKPRKLSENVTRSSNRKGEDKSRRKSAHVLGTSQIESKGLFNDMFSLSKTESIAKEVDMEANQGMITKIGNLVGSDNAPNTQSVNTDKKSTDTVSGEKDSQMSTNNGMFGMFSQMNTSSNEPKVTFSATIEKESRVNDDDNNGDGGGIFSLLTGTNKKPVELHTTENDTKVNEAGKISKLNGSSNKPSVADSSTTEETNENGGGIFSILIGTSNKLTDSDPSHTVEKKTNGTVSIIKANGTSSNGPTETVLPTTDESKDNVGGFFLKLIGIADTPIESDSLPEKEAKVHVTISKEESKPNGNGTYSKGNNGIDNGHTVVDSSTTDETKDIDSGFFSKLIGTTNKPNESDSSVIKNETKLNGNGIVSKVNGTSNNESTVADLETTVESKTNEVGFFSKLIGTINENPQELVPSFTEKDSNVNGTNGKGSKFDHSVTKEESKPNVNGKALKMNGVSSNSSTTEETKDSGSGFFSILLGTTNSNLNESENETKLNGDGNVSKVNGTINKETPLAEDGFFSKLIGTTNDQHKESDLSPTENERTSQESTLNGNGTVLKLNSTSDEPAQKDSSTTEENDGGFFSKIIGNTNGKPSESVSSATEKNSKVNGHGNLSTETGSLTNGESSGNDGGFFSKLIGTTIGNPTESTSSATEQNRKVNGHENPTETGFLTNGESNENGGGFLSKLIGINYGKPAEIDPSAIDKNSKPNGDASVSNVIETGKKLPDKEVINGSNGITSKQRLNGDSHKMELETKITTRRSSEARDGQKQRSAETLEKRERRKRERRRRTREEREGGVKEGERKERRVSHGEERRREKRERRSHKDQRDGTGTNEEIKDTGEAVQTDRRNSKDGKRMRRKDRGDGARRRRANGEQEGRDGEAVEGQRRRRRRVERSENIKHLEEDIPVDGKGTM